MDWYLCSDSVTWVCAVLDDASHMILSGGEFSAATAENSINLLREALMNIKISPLFDWNRLCESVNSILGNSVVMIACIMEEQEFV